MAVAAEIHPGACLCGAVRYSVTGPLAPPDACHCSQCRKQSGHYWASTDVSKAALKIEGEVHLTWFRSSEEIRRGFCNVCGSFLFWDRIAADRIAVAMGSFIGPTGTAIEQHIYVASKGDYYSIDDGLPQHQG